MKKLLWFLLAVPFFVVADAWPPQTGSGSSAAIDLTGTTLAPNVVNSSLRGAASGVFGTGAYTPAPMPVSDAASANTVAGSLNGTDISFFTLSGLDINNKVLAPTVASSSVAGTVKPDNTTITVNGSGVLSVLGSGTITSLQSSAVPIGIAGSGVVAASGVFTSDTAFAYTYNTPCVYLHFDANALAASSPAAIYSLTMASATSGVVSTTTYNPTTHAAPICPASPTPYTTTAGSYAGHTGGTYVLLAEVPIAANSMGINGSINAGILAHSFNNANSKVARVSIGTVSGTIGAATPLQYTLTGSTVAAGGSYTSIRNKGIATKQTVIYGTGTSETQIAVDTTAQLYLQVNAANSTTGDWITIDDYWFRLNYGN